VLNTQSEKTNTIFYSDSAYFVHTFTLNMCVCMSYTGFNQAEYVFHILVIAPQEYVNICSTCRVKTILTLAILTIT